MQTHLKGFGLENFRVFKDYTWFDFAPITILTGPNSSGKSSLNKALMLMKDNLSGKRELFKSEIKHPITKIKMLSFDGSAHNLSSDRNSFSKDSQNPFISFFFKNQTLFVSNPIQIKISHLVRERAMQVETNKDNLKRILGHSNSIDLVNSENHSFFRFFCGSKPSFYCDLPEMVKIATEFLNELETIIGKELKIYEAYMIQFDSVHPARQYLFDMKNILEEFINNFTNLHCHSHQVDLADFFKNNSPFIQENIFYEDIVDDLGHFNSSVSESDFISLFSKKVDAQFGFLLVMNGHTSDFDKSDVHCLFPENSAISILINSFVSALSILTGTFDTIRQTHKPPEILLPDLRDLHYLPSIKGFNDRSFRSKDEHILNVLYKEYKNYGIDEMLGSEEPRRVFFENWFSKFGLESIKMERDDRLDSNFYTVNGFSNVDIGYGMSQIIAVILRILSVADSPSDSMPYPKPAIIILEEPESNLHPKFQSLLADLLIEAAETFEIQFIIETHSEYLIRKLQYLTAKKQVKTSDSVIYYFHDPNNVPKGEKQVKKIEILEDGSLSDDFGPGFFDEAANWELELIRLKNAKTRNN